MISEFQFIKDVKSRYSLDKIGDDCAVLPKNEEFDMLISGDMLVEDVDFRRDWMNPEFLGHKALAVSLSDIAAMGGTPLFSTLSIAIPKVLWNDDFLDRFYAGYMSLAAATAVQLVGGDLSSSPEKIVIDSTVIGEVNKGAAKLRSGARAGDLICVTGELGAAAAGLRLLGQGLRTDSKLARAEETALLRQLRPTPRLKELKQFLPQVTSMIDVSDGISSDLRHICEASGVGAHLFAEKLPIDGSLPDLFPDYETRLELALNGGEDFELLFTIDPGKYDSTAVLGISVIGVITSESGRIELIKDSTSRPLPAKGFDHFDTP